MFDTTRPKVYSQSELETRNLILHVRSRKWRYLFIILIMGGYFFYLFKNNILQYSSTATFIVNDRSVIATSLGLEGLSTSENFVRVYELANSLKTQTHLINKFGLLKHYGIDTTKEFYMQKAIAKIRSKIVVAKSPMNTISVTVKDHHRYLTAEMANEIVSYIEKLNHDYYVNNIRQRLRISKGLTDQFEKDSYVKTAAIDTLIRKLNLLITSGKVNQQTSYELLAHQQKLSEIIGNFKNSSTELLTTQKMYAQALQALNFQNFPTTTLIQQAMPAFRSISYSAALYSLGAMIAVFLLLVMQAYFYMSYKHYITLIFTGR